MGEAYPELVRAQERVTSTLRQEEERFGETLEHGMAILDAALAGGRRELDGETAFKLYDTYGFPVDLTADIGRERGFTVDMKAFDAAMAAQQERSRAASKFKAGQALEYTGVKTAFRGYDTLSEEGRVIALYREGAPVDRLYAGEAGIVVLDRTPFYAESGGQVGDRGELTKGGTCLTLFAVEDTQKIQPDVFGHAGTVTTGELALGDTVAAQVDLDKRTRTMRHHSVTHLMHKALREVLGGHVQQKGSLVDEDKTRFDFSHNAPVTADELRRVEAIVNAEILANAATQARVMPIDEAQKIGAMMLFGEKYGDEVRVLDIGTSRELCGGTHVARTGDIGYFRIVSEGGVAAGIRRVEAVAGSVALGLAQADRDRLARAAEALKAQPQEIDARIAQVVENVKALEKEVARLKGQLAFGKLDDVMAMGMRTVNGVKAVALVLDGADAGMLREALDKVKERLGSGVVLLAAVADGKVSLVAGVTRDLTGKVKAGDLVNFVAQQVGGKGGGRPDMAQAGGTNPAALGDALKSVEGWLAGRL